MPPKKDAPKMPTIVPPLTDIQVKNTKPKDKPYKLADGGGLYLEVMPTGSPPPPGVTLVVASRFYPNIEATTSVTPGGLAHN
jgi:hypothetical protein